MATVTLPTAEEARCLAPDVRRGVEQALETIAFRIIASAKAGRSQVSVGDLFPAGIAAMMFLHGRSGARTSRYVLGVLSALEEKGYSVAAVCAAPADIVVSWA